MGVNWQSEDDLSSTCLHILLASWDGLYLNTCLVTICVSISITISAGLSVGLTNG